MGCGVIIRRLFGLRIQGAESVLTSFWMGWALTLCVLQLWHFAFPIDGRTSILIVVGGTTGLLWNYHDLFHFVKRLRFRHWCVILIFLMSAVWLANHSLSPNLPYDVGLYHVPTVRWMQSFPIVPGLGNLHSRFGFNSSFFLYVALLDIGPWAGKSLRLANGLLVLVVLAQIYLSAVRLFLKREIELYHIFNVLLLAAVLNLTLHYSFPSAWADLSIFTLGIVLSSQLLCLFEKSKRDSREAGYAVFFIASISVVGCTVKLSFVALGVATSLLVLLAWYFRSEGEGRSGEKNTLAWAILAIAVVIIPWMARGVVLSGYPVFPSTFCSFPVEWRMPYQDVVATAKSIVAYARSEVPWHGVVEKSDWVTPWMSEVGGRFEVVGPLLLMFVGLLVKLCWKSKDGHLGGVSRTAWLFLLPAMLSLPYWFLTAPSVRFAGASFWVVGAGTAALSIGGIPRLSNSAKSWLTVVLCMILCQRIFIGGHRDCLFTIIKEKDVHKALGKLYRTGALVMTRPMTIDGYFAIPSVQVKTFVTDSGLTVYVPEKGGKCWDSPLPCTPNPDADLQLREQGNLRHGFMVHRGREKDASIDRR